MAKEPKTIGLSESGKRKLKNLKEDGYFREMIDAYRFAIALALAHDAKPTKSTGGKETIFNVGSLDPDGSLYAAISVLRKSDDEPIWWTAEGLAEWGVEKLSEHSKSGEIGLINSVVK